MHRTKKHHFSPDYHVEIAFGSQVRGTRGGGGGVAFSVQVPRPPWLGTSEEVITTLWSVG